MEQAALELGIPMDDVYTYVSERMGVVDTLNFQLRLVGQAAIKTGLTKLSQLAEGGQRAMEMVTLEGSAEVGFEKTTEKLASDDLEAAKALVKFGLDSLKLSRAPLSQRDDDKAQKDLFDLSQPNPWELKKIE